MKKILIVGLLMTGCAGPSAEPEAITDAQRYRAEPRPHQAKPVEPSPGSLTLDQALALAERVHPDLSAAKARVDAAEGRAHQAGLLPNPTLVARMESAPFSGGTTSQAEYVAGINQRLPVGGRLGAARDSERLEAERLRREFDLRLFDVRAQVRGAFATALFASEVSKAQTELLELSRRAVTVAQARRAAGDATADEVARSEVEEARASLEAGKARGLRELALVRLSAALGDPALRTDSIEGSLEAVLEIPSLESVLVSLDAGPFEAIARADVESARARVDLAKAERIPDVSLDLFYRRLEQSKANTFDVGIVVPLPVFDRNQGRIRAAEAEQREAEARARSNRGDAIRRVREAHVKLSEAVNRTKLVKDQILPKAGTVLKVAEARYAAGELNLTEVLLMRRDGAAARLAYLEALRETMEAWAELKAFIR
jgi:outer membrane protein, heavy metal efflux system